MVTIWSKRVATSPVKMGSGQCSAQAPQKVHSPAAKSSVGRRSTRLMISLGQCSTHIPQPVQDASASSAMPGGRMRATSLGRLPLRKSRLDNASCRIAPPSMTGRAGRPVEDLEHPDKEAITTDHGYGDDRPDTEGEHKKGEELLATATGTHSGWLRNLFWHFTSPTNAT